ncbi:hypothetical protein JVU11DRAFT_4651 [Chiua virens]|nr:hypothetical protein JVU11DRAFT_4651 [Chiua virens]
MLVWIVHKTLVVDFKSNSVLLQMSGIRGHVRTARSDALDNLLLILLVQMADTFDLEELVHLEQTCYDAGYTDGVAHGRIHGLIDGCALGRTKGFEIWEEIGYYEGFAETWKAVAPRGRVRRPLAHWRFDLTQRRRTLHHITHLLALIRQFPTVNPSQHEVHIDADLEKLQRQIRSRYKALCASLGVRPTLRAAGADDPTDEDPGGSPRAQGGCVDPDADARSDGGGQWASDDGAGLEFLKSVRDGLSRERGPRSDAPWTVSVILPRRR